MLIGVISINHKTDKPQSNFIKNKKKHKYKTQEIKEKYSEEQWKLEDS